jgi:outer membrane protein OmpA-like peptidoglycan-associated protein
VANVDPSDLKPLALDRDTPLDLYQARNAVRIATWAGAEEDAADTLGRAKQLLQQAETHKAEKAGTKLISMAARESVQTAEDARLVALQRQEDQRVAAERRAAAEREAQAKREARLETERRASAEAAAARAKQEADLAAEQARKDRDRLEAEAERARQAVADAEREKAKLRSQLMDQLNLILETRESARGLIVNLSDVLFDFNKYTLKPGAREKLSKISGIVLSHPGLMLEVEGHTDSVGTDEYNMDLSVKRATAVRDYLVQQAIPPGSITARGFGESRPVASNDHAAGRQQNRRVELIVSGELIGVPTSPTSRLTQPQ